jgi:hypothetical protein
MSMQREAMEFACELIHPRSIVEVRAADAEEAAETACGTKL